MAENTQNKYVSPSRLSTFLENLKNIFSPLTHGHTISEISDYIVDTELSATSNNPVANSTIDAELDAIADGLGALELAIDGKVETSDVVDDLTTASADKPLSANQGVILQDQITTINSTLADLLYEEIAISSFKNNVGTVEVGSTVDSVTLTWTTSKTPSALTLEGASIDSSLTGYTYSDLGLTPTTVTTKTYTLKATDERDYTASKTTSIYFYNGIYYGVGTTASDFTSDFVIALSKKLQNAKAYDFTVNPTAQYIYYAVPTRLGTVTFKVGGFEGGFESPETVSVTNSFGFTENYYVYRSTNTITGSTTVDVT